MELSSIIDFNKTAGKYPIEYLIVDALILANIGGKADATILEYIVDIATIIGLGKEKLKVLGLITRTILCQSFDFNDRETLVEVLDNINNYKHYVSNEMISQAIQSLRVIVVQETDDNVYEFKWKVEKNQEVKKGDVIATFYRTSGWYVWGNKDFKTVKSKESGTIFTFKDNKTYYGVVAYYTDDKDEIKNWIRGK